MQQKEYKCKYGWVGKVIDRKRFKFTRTDKTEMPKLESLIEKVTNKILSNFDIAMDHQIPAGKKELVVKWILPFHETFAEK